MAKKKRTTQRRGSKKTAGRRKKRPVRRKPVRRTAARRVKKTAGRRKSAGRPEGSAVPTESTTRGLGPESGGQSGDAEGLSRAEVADSESVEELLEEGQAFEAGIVSGVENAPDADKGGVRTRQVPEDDVPQEYLDED